MAGAQDPEPENGPDLTAIFFHMLDPKQTEGAMKARLYWDYQFAFAAKLITGMTAGAVKG